MFKRKALKFLSFKEYLQINKKMTQKNIIKMGKVNEQQSHRREKQMVNRSKLIGSALLAVRY